MNEARSSGLRPGELPPDATSAGAPPPHVRQRTEWRFPLSVSVAYAVLAAAWILASDSLVEAVGDAALVSRLQTYKGWLFVLVTSLLLYLLLSRAVPGRDAEESDIEGPADRRLTWTLVVAAGALVGVFVLNLMYTVQKDRDELLRQAAHNAANLSHVLEGQVGGMLSAVDATLLGTSRAVRMLANAHGAQATMSELLQDQVRALPYVKSMFVLDAAGRIVYSSGTDPPPAGAPHGDREYFRAHLHAGVAAVHIAASAAGEIPVSRVLRAAHGRFGGVVVAVLDAGYLSRFFAAVRVGKRGAVGLMLRDGTLLASASHPAVLADRAVGTNPAEPASGNAWALIRSSVSATQAGAEILGLRPVANWPVAVFAALDREEVLAAWRTRARTYGLVSLAFALVIGWLGWLVVRQLRRRAALNAALRVSEARFATVFHASPTPQAITDIDTSRFIDVNCRFADMFGCPAAEMIGRSAFDLGLFCEPDTQATMLASIFEGDGPHTMHVAMRRRDGSEREVLLSWVKMQVPGRERPVLVSLATDVTEQLRAERAIAENERRYRMLFDANPHPMWMYDGESGRILAVNGAACRAYGYARDEFLGVGTEGLGLPEERAAQPESGGGAGHGAPTETVTRHVRKDGTLIDVQLIAQPMQAWGENTRLALATDITQRVAAEREIRALNAELERRVAARTAELQAVVEELESFSYSVSHDLRAPLRHLDGYARLLMELPAARDRVSGGYLQHIVDAAARMARLIDGLLALSRAGRVPLRRERVDLSALVSDVTEECMRDAAGRRIAWQVGALPGVTGDEALLRQVLLNLVSNAVKFTAGRETARIEIAANRSAGEICVCIADNGAGFDMRYVDQLFAPFRRLHSASEFDGTGIGLATVKRIVQRHGGRVWAEGVPGGGARFFVALAECDPCAGDGQR